MVQNLFTKELPICSQLIYIESIIQNDETIDLGSVPGGLDWVMGDDRPGAKARDLENPQFSTWEEVMNLTEEHDRGEVIGHWFYLISQGSGPGFQVPIPPLGWTVQGAGSGNSVTGNCLTVLDWPEYAYYPQIFSIRLYNITQEFQLRYNLRMEDCEGDDPDCNDVGVNNFESNNSSSSHYAVERTDSDHLFDKELPIHLKVFDINGRKVYEGKNLDQSFNSDNLEGLLIYCYYDQQGKIIETKKMVIIK